MRTHPNKKTKMKKSIMVFSIALIASTVILSCKKKEEPAPAPAPVNNTPPAHVNKMTAKVNNADWAMASQNGYFATFVSSAGGNYSFGAQNSFNSPYTFISVSFNYTTGLVTFGQTLDNSARYKDANGTNFTARTGTLNISNVDTVNSKGSIFAKLSATFSFNTDTIGGTSYQITNGVIDYQKSN